jgi:shikimate kinase/3-dehydroquinate synthase
MKSKNIALIGFSTTGKSAVGKKVAENLGWDFIDIDDEIASSSGKSISEIFSQDGEKRFRQLEKDILKKACTRNNVVIATGGGAVVDPDNQAMLQECTIICLESKADTIYRRLVEDTVYSASPVIRPLLVDENPLEKIINLKSHRQINYAIADWTIHTDNLTVEEASREVEKGWRYINRAGECTYFPDSNESICTVETESRNYPVFIGRGILDKLGNTIRSIGLSGTMVIISDDAVFALYGKKVLQELERQSYKSIHYTMPPGEDSKSLGNAKKIYDFLIENRVERSDTIIALGGGMAGDLAGFVASTFLRGLSWIQIPTSLVAMADASIGGKVAVNHRKGKNLIGAFYQPHFVLTDIDTLKTLPARELTSGWAEVVKYGLIDDAVLFEKIEANIDKITGLDPATTLEVISQGAFIKARFVSEDERENGRRTLLNYGHTMAHGLEAMTKYHELLHGEAVAIGMSVAVRISHYSGLIPLTIVQRQQSVLERLGLPTTYSGIKLTGLLRAMKLDKKVENKAIRWVLLEDIGKAVIRNDIPEDIVKKAIEDVIEL